MPLEITGIITAMVFFTWILQARREVIFCWIALERIAIFVAYQVLLVGRWFHLPRYQNVLSFARSNKLPFQQKIQDLILESNYGILWPLQKIGIALPKPRLDNHPAILPPPPHRIELGHFGPIDGGTFLPCGILQNQNNGCQLGW